MRETRDQILVFALTLMVSFAPVFVYAQSVDTGITGYEGASTTSNNASANDAINLDELIDNNKYSTEHLSSDNGRVNETTTTTNEELSGDDKLACEAILCLSSATKPGECSPSLDRYFSITDDKWSDTVKKRKNFLNRCPASNEDANMISLTNTLAEGSGLCSIERLNNRGVFKNIVSKIDYNYNQCRQAPSSKIIAPSGKYLTKSYEWISYEGSKNSKNKSYCQQTIEYWAVTEYAPGECTQLWNHIYTDYSQRPSVVKGSDAWETHWAEK